MVFGIEDVEDILIDDRGLPNGLITQKDYFVLRRWGHLALVTRFLAFIFHVFVSRIGTNKKTGLLQ